MILAEVAKLHFGMSSAILFQKHAEYQQWFGKKLHKVLDITRPSEFS